MRTVLAKRVSKGDAMFFKDMNVRDLLTSLDLKFFKIWNVGNVIRVMSG